MFYAQSVEESLRNLDCTPSGLTTHVAELRTEHYEKNLLLEAKKMYSHRYIYATV